MARNALQTGYDDGNALALAPWGVGDPTDPVSLAGTQNTVAGADALSAWLASMRAKSEATRPIWNPNNPVGTEVLQSMGMPDPSFRPGVMVGGGTVPMSQEQIDAVRTGSQNAYDQLALIAGAGRGGQAFPGTGSVALASRRPLANPPPGGGLSLERVNPRNLRPMSEAPSLDTPGNHTYFVRNPAGEHLATVDTEWNPNLGELHIADVQSPEGANSLGPAAVKQLREALLEQYPDAKTLSGYRITGAGPNRETFQRLRPYQGREE